MRKRTLLVKDSEIIALLHQKDTRGIALLYDQYSNYLMGCILKIVKNEYFAEAALQNTFLKIWDNKDTYCPAKSSLYTWSLNIAKNAAIDMVRSKIYKQSLQLVNLETLSTSFYTSNPNQNIEKMDIQNIIYTLDSKYCQLIEMAYFEGYTHLEIAEALQIPLGTVKTRIRKAFYDLRKLLTE